METFFKRATTGVAIILSFLALFLYLPPIYTSLSLLIIFLIILFFEWPRILGVKNPLFWILLPFYLMLPFGLMIYMNSIEKYRDLLFYMLILTFSNDSGGYFVGKLIGKHKLADMVSPKKTWEGLFGGYIFTCFSIFLILHYTKSDISFLFIAIFGFAISISATLGDLFESFLKRKAKIKDSGNILPGHGGLLDRFDSIIYIVFITFFLKDYLIKIFNPL